MGEAAKTTDNQKRLAVISEAINLEPIEGIRRYGRELSNAFEAVTGFKIFRIGFSVESAEKAGGLARIKEIISCRRKLREINADVIVYIPSSPRMMMNILKFCLWKGRSGRRALILLQPPKGSAPFAGRILRGAKLFRQFDLSQLPPSLRKKSWRAIPSGVDTSDFRPVSRAERDILKIKFGFAPSDRIVVSVGHLTEGRNLGVLMKIARSVDAKTVFVTSKFEGDIPDILTRLKESGVIVMNQYLEKIQEIYSIADCYVFPTKYSGSAIGMPLSILEALSCNVPVISTRFGITPQILKEGRGVAFFDDDETAVRLVRERISEAHDDGPREVALSFDWTNIAKSIISEI